MVVARSTDAGTSWQSLVCDTTTGLSTGRVAADPVDTNVVYCAGSATDRRTFVYRSTNRGQTWTRALAGNGFIPFDLLVSSADHNLILVGTFSSGVLRSTDAGSTWAVAGSVRDFVYSLAESPGSPAAFYGMIHNQIQIRALTVRPPLFLAPMAGLTHSALRTLLLSFVGVGLLSTEMLSARRLPAENASTSPYLVRTAIEVPLSYQLLIAAPEEVAPAVETLHRLGADAIDLNLGCPAPKVRQAGGGSSLMADPQRVRRIVGTARALTSLPLTAKIRLGETLDAGRLREFCQMLAEEGIDLGCRLSWEIKTQAEP